MNKLKGLLSPLHYFQLLKKVKFITFIPIAVIVITLLSGIPHKVYGCCSLSSESPVYPSGISNTIRNSSPLRLASYENYRVARAENNEGDGPLYYARWKKGEIDLVSILPDRKFSWATEVKWSDAYPDNISKLSNIVKFCHSNNLPKIWITTKTITRTTKYQNISFEFTPASEYCFNVGYNRIKSRKSLLLTG